MLIADSPRRPGVTAYFALVGISNSDLYVILRTRTGWWIVCISRMSFFRDHWVLCVGFTRWCLALAPGNPTLGRRVPVTTIHKSAGATKSKKDINFSSITFQFCMSILSCFFDLLPVKCHQEARALTINSDNHLQSAACFENSPERPNVKCIRKR